MDFTTDTKVKKEVYEYRESWWYLCVSFFPLRGVRWGGGVRRWRGRSLTDWLPPLHPLHQLLQLVHMQPTLKDQPLQLPVTHIINTTERTEVWKIHLTCDVCIFCCSHRSRSKKLFSAPRCCRSLQSSLANRYPLSKESSPSASCETPWRRASLEEGALRGHSSKRFKLLKFLPSSDPEVWVFCSSGDAQKSASE